MEREGGLKGTGGWEGNRGGAGREVERSVAGGWWGWVRGGVAVVWVMAWVRWGGWGMVDRSCREGGGILGSRKRGGFIRGGWRR